MTSVMSSEGQHVAAIDASFSYTMCGGIMPQFSSISVPPPLTLRLVYKVNDRGPQNLRSASKGSETDLFNVLLIDGIITLAQACGDPSSMVIFTTRTFSTAHVIQ